ncbi:MAG: L-sorbosone dehydrogenase, partial [Planctomycetota bacterium]
DPAALRILAAARPKAAAEIAVDILAGFRPNEPQVPSICKTIAQATQRKPFASAFQERMTASERGTIPVDVARCLVRELQSVSADDALIAGVRDTGKLQDASWKWDEQWATELIALAKQSGDPARGETIYRRKNLQCISCHAIGTGGGIIGPNLISLGAAAQSDYILRSLIEPSDRLKEGYGTLQILCDDGQIRMGIPIGENDETLRLRDAEGKTLSVAKDSIEIRKTGPSLMPAGLVDSLTRQELADLLRFLSALGREPAFTVRADGKIRSLETLIYSQQANRRLNRSSVDAVSGDDPVFQWRSQTTRVNGTLPIHELDTFRQHRQTPPTSFVRLQFQMLEPGRPGKRIPTEGLECWIDGKPTPVWDLEQLQLTAGTHTMVLAIDRSRVEKGFAIRRALGLSINRSG